MKDSIAFASAYSLNGVNFRTSADALAQQLDLDGDGRPTSLMAIPMYFLASQAAELFLKSALLKRGFPERELRSRDLGHDLDALLIKLQTLGATVAAKTADVVHGLSEQHRTHQLRYTALVDDGTETYWPPLSLVFTTLDELLLLTRSSDPQE
jgi:hypothetical protein